MLINKLKISIIGLLVLITTPIFSQIIDPDKTISQYTHTIYGDEEGIRDVLDITQDSAGYIWIASYEGLFRYDGTNFKLFNQSNRGDFDANSVRSLYPDHTGDLWIGTNDHGLAQLKNNKFKMYDKDDGLPNNSVRNLYTDSINRTWVGTAAGLALFQNEIFTTFPDFSDLNTLQTLFTIENNHKEIIIGTNKNNGLYLYKNNKMYPFNKFDTLIDQKIEYMIQDGKTTDYWIITTTDLYRVKEDKITEQYTINDLHNNDQELTLQKLYLDKNNTLWIIADGGIAKLYNEELSFYFVEDGLSDGLVKCAFQDEEGTLWVGTRSGLDKFVEPKFTVYSTNEGLINNAINTVLQDDKDQIWIGTNHGISIFNREQEQFISNDQLDNLEMRIRHLSMDSKNRIWISTYGSGAVMYENDEIKKWYNKDNGLAGNKVRTIMEDSKNRIWVGTTTGLSIIENDEIRTYSSDNGMSFEYVMCFFEDENGKIWIGTDGGGILFYEKGEFTTVLTKDDGLAGNVIFRIFKDSQNIIWVTTGNGISRISNTSIDNFDSSDGLIVNSIFQILEDKDHKFWMTSSEGLFCIDSKDFYSGKLNVKVYNSLNGLPGGATATAWAIQDSNEDLWIPTYNGVAILNPNNISTNRIPPKIAIDNEVLIDNIRNTQYNATLLKPDTKRVTFSFASLSFQIPENVYTQYKLVGFDDKWSPLSTKRDAIYTNLSPGNYSFHVRGYNNDGLISTNDATFKFKKQPHFYETLWFTFLVSAFCITLIGLIIFKINSLRLKRLQRQFDIQEKQLKLERKAKETEHTARINEMKLTKSYSRFVPHEFIELLNKKNIQNVELGDQTQKEMTIFVTDIRNFTTLSETMNPEENFNFLNTYLAKIVPIIRENGGLIDKYMGDGIMALFPKESVKSVATAVKFQEVLRQFNAERQASKLIPIHAGISIHTGSLMLGILGEENRMDATVISDAVNTTFRLETLTKYYKCAIIISEEVKNIVGNLFTTRFLSTVMVKGKSNPVKIFEVLEGNSKELLEQKESQIEQYNNALELFFNREFSTALEQFTILSEESPNDELYKIYIQNCNEFLVCNPYEKWDGIIKL